MKPYCWLWVALIFVGCVCPNGTWEAQRQTALSIQDPQQRADALATAAEAAGSIGDIVTVKKALGDLANDPRHDEVAERAAPSNWVMPRIGFQPGKRRT